MSTAREHGELPGRASSPEARPVAAASATHLPGAVLALQRAAGNRAATQLLQRATPPDDWRPTTFPEPVVEPDPQLPWRTDALVDYAPGPERIFARDVGNWIHNNYEMLQSELLRYAELLTTERLPAGLEPEYRIPDPRVPWYRRDRVDRVDWRALRVYEIKPETRLAEAEAQAQRYVGEMNRLHFVDGRSWTYRLVPYNLRRATGMLLELGYFSPESVRQWPLYSWRLDAYARGAYRLPPPNVLAVWTYMRPTRSFRPAPRNIAPPGSPLGDFMRPGTSTRTPGVTPAEYMRPGTRRWVPVPYDFPPQPPAPGWTDAPDPPAPRLPPPPAGTERVSPTVVRRPAPVVEPEPPAGGGGGGALGKGVTALSVATTIPGIVNMARDMRIEAQLPMYLGPAVLEDQHGQYTLRKEEGWVWNAYFKTYISGELEGQEVELSWWDWWTEMDKRAKKYGYFNWRGEFIEGEVKPRYHEGIPPGSA